MVKFLKLSLEIIAMTKRVFQILNNSTFRLFLVCVLAAIGGILLIFSMQDLLVQ